MKNMKKILRAAVAVMLVALAATPVAAHGGSHHNSNKRTVNYSICATESCTQTGLHYHGGKAYSAHYYGDGHDYHEYCELEDCAVAGYHSHDGTYCFGHAYGDGHDYHDYCGVRNCTLTGYHEHDGDYCFGHTANDGHGYHHSGRGRR